MKTLVTMGLGGLVMAFCAVGAMGCSDAGGGGGGGGGGEITANSKGLCSKPLDPCGGDLVGDWKVTSSCFMELPECTTSYKISKLPTLTFSFHTDGTAVLSAMGTGNVQAVQDLACTGANTCTDLNDSENNVVCSANGADACTCNAATSVSVSSPASYTVATSTVTVALSAESSIAYDFCVKGNTLELKANELGVVYVLARQ